jgi:hypothetical protein
MEQRFKIFIAYHINEENIATLLSEYFQNMGIPKDFIYLCGLPSNDGKVINIDEINAMIKCSCVNIPILSQKFLESTFCTNVTGAFVFDENAVEDMIGIVGLGCTVKVRDLEFDETDVYVIVGSQEANPMEARISDDSPFGKAMLGKRVGDLVEYEAPSGIVRFEILAVER